MTTAAVGQKEIQYATPAEKKIAYLAEMSKGEQ
jgi:hypothetical protein